MGKRILAVTGRIYRQLWGDRRFLALALMVPLVIVYVLKLFLDSMPEMASRWFAAGRLDILMTAFIVHFTTYILCLIVFVRERREQTLTRMFVSNYRRSDMVLGYLFGYAGLGTAQTALAILEVKWLFDLEWSLPSLVSVFVVIWTVSMISIAFGMLVSSLARTEAQIFPFIPLFILPTVFLSGVFLPVESLPWAIRWASYVIPFTYAIEVLRPIAQNGDSLFSHLAAFARLLTYGAALLALATLSVRERD